MVRFVFSDKMKFQVTILLLASLAAFANAAIKGFSGATLAVAKSDGSPIHAAVGVTIGDIVKFTCTSFDTMATSFKLKREGRVIYTSPFIPATRFPNEALPAYSHTMVNADVSPDGGTTSYTCQVSDRTVQGADSTPKKVKVITLPVEPDSILINEITSTSAKVTWKPPRSDVSYEVSIIPTAEGTWLDPNPVPRGTTKVTLRNLTPGTVYQITIWTVLGSTLRSQSKKSFQTPAIIPKDEQLETLSTAGLAVAVTCLVVIIILIVLIVIIFRRIDQNATRCDGTGNNTHIPMSNIGFERDHQPRKAPTPVVGKSSEFKTWLLSKQVSEDTYEVIQREGFHDPAMFALLKPDEVSRLAIKPMAQELLLKDIVESFNKGETPFQTCGTAGDELYDDVTNEKYEHLRVA